jgi:hypothetical protein
MFIFGGVGRDRAVPYNDVWASSDGLNWSCITDIAQWSPREPGACVVFKSRMWIIGGSNYPKYYNDVWRSSDGVEWTCATDSAGWLPRMGQASVVYNNKMWIMGGINSDSGAMDDVWYSYDGSEWTCATDSAGWAKRSRHSSVVFDSKIWIFGGNIPGSSNYNHEVWSYEENVDIKESDSRTPEKQQVLNINLNISDNVITISYTLQKPSVTKISIFNSNGRQIKVLCNETMPFGTHKLLWNRYDSSGKKAPAGVYIIRLETEGFKKAQKISVVD